ncbi:MAG: peroxiredoxin [Nitrospinae bacterium]|nr:peroxiredoxin [Nitrospinota bacterium]
MLRPQNPTDELDGLRQAVLNAPTIADVYKHYRGENVPDEEFFKNALSDTFGLPSDKVDEFKKRGVEVLGVSIDSQFSHLAWRNTDRKKGGIGQIQYPLLADLDKKISRDYGVLADAGIAFRGLFLIDKEGVVQHALVNNLPLGRNVDEALRMVDALQHHEEHGEVCPANWKKGDEAMKPGPKESQPYFAKHN